MYIPKFIIKTIKMIDAEKKLRIIRQQKMIENTVSRYLYTHHVKSEVCKDCIKHCGFVYQLDNIQNGNCKYKLSK